MNSLIRMVSPKVYLNVIKDHPFNEMTYLLYRYVICNRVTKWAKVSNLSEVDFKSQLENNTIQFVQECESKHRELINSDINSMLEQLEQNAKYWIDKANTCYNDNPEHFSVNFGLAIDNIIINQNNHYVYNDNLAFYDDTLMVTYFSFDDYCDQIEKIFSSRDEDYCVYVVSRSIILGNMYAKDGYIDMLNVYEHYNGSEMYDRYQPPSGLDKYELYSSAVVLVKMFCNVLLADNYQMPKNAYYVYKDFVGLYLMIHNLNIIRHLKWKVSLDNVSDLELIHLLLYAYVDLGKQNYSFCGHGYHLLNIKDTPSVVNEESDDIYQEVDNYIYEQCMFIEKWINNIDNDVEIIESMSEEQNSIISYPTLKAIVKNDDILGCIVKYNDSPVNYINKSLELALEKIQP